MANTAEIVLEIKDLDISFRSAGEEIHAIRGVDLVLHRGETVAIVGESGSGKSVSMKAAMGILADNARINGGSILYRPEPGAEPVDLLKADPAWIRKNIRGRSIAMVFQDPMTSLNPTMTIGAQLITAIRAHENVSRKEAADRALTLLSEVGITEPERRMRQYPHEFSGGMRQRIVIAIALSCNPKLLLADEPTTALDVTIQAQILELMKTLQREEKTSIIFITHNLGVVAEICDRVSVMYAGKIVEQGKVNDIFYKPLHPYTRGLLASMPRLDEDSHERLIPIEGTPIDLLNPPKGCNFAPRCPYAKPECIDTPQTEQAFSDTHVVMCSAYNDPSFRIQRGEVTV